MTDVYPGIDDWDREVLDNLPGVARAGFGGDFALALSSPLAAIELEVESWARELADIEIAGPYVAAMRCYQYNLNPVGLSLHEMRRLAAAGEIALASDGTHARMWNAWKALRGREGGRVELRYSPSQASYGVFFYGGIGWQPSPQFIAQAGALVARLPAEDAECEAVVYLDGSFTLDSGPGFGVGVLSYHLPTG